MSHQENLQCPIRVILQMTINLCKVIWPYPEWQAKAVLEMGRVLLSQGNKADAADRMLHAENVGGVGGDRASQL